MWDFDDSSDENAILDGDIIEHWKTFNQEVLSDLKARTQTLISKETSKSSSLYKWLEKIKTSQGDLLSLTRATIDSAEALPFDSATLTEDEKKFLIGNCKKGEAFKKDKLKSTIETRLKLHKNRFTDFTNGVKKILKEVGNNGIVTDVLKKYEVSSLTLSYGLDTKKESIFINKLDTINLKIINWMDEEKRKVEYVLQGLEKFQLFLNNMELLEAACLADIQNIDCQFSFLSHYLGLEVLQNPEVTEYYHTLKSKWLTHQKKSEKFHYEILKSSLIEDTVNSFSEKCSEVFGRRLKAKVVLFLNSELKKEENLRRVLKGVNRLNDYLLFRSMYDCVNKKRYSFSEFLKLGLQEVKSALIEVNPVLELLEYVDFYLEKVVSDFEVGSNAPCDKVFFCQETNQYWYKNMTGFGNIKVFNNSNNKLSINSENKEVLHRIILDNHLPGKMPKICYILFQERAEVYEDTQCTSIKDFYLSKKEFLVKDTLKLMHEYNQCYIHFKVIQEEPDETIKQKILHQQLIAFRENDDHAYIMYFSRNNKIIQEIVERPKMQWILLSKAMDFEEIDDPCCIQVKPSDQIEGKYSIKLKGEKPKLIPKTNNIGLLNYGLESFLEKLFGEENEFVNDRRIIKASFNSDSEIYQFTYKAIVFYAENSDAFLAIKFYFSIFNGFFDERQTFRHKDRWFLNEVNAYLKYQGQPDLRSIYEILEEQLQSPEFLCHGLLSSDLESDLVGQSILQHVFILILHEHFYNTCNASERKILSDKFEFSSDSPIQFLSNVRLSNRSLKRQSRNLIQNPVSRFQIESINSGSEPLVTSNKTWRFSYNSNSAHFFAVDRQVINNKFSEKKPSLLSREHYVAFLGAYSSIQETVIRNMQDLQGSEIASSIRDNLFNPPEEEDMPFIGKLKRTAYLSSLYYLLFGVEAMRNPAMLIVNHMLLDLLDEGCITIGDMFGGSGTIAIEGKNFYYINGLMPTSPKNVTARSRELNNLYSRYMPVDYFYPGDFSRNKDGTPSARDEAYKTKLGLNHLIYRESLVVKMWLTLKGYNYEDNFQIDAIIDLVREGIQNWWLKNENQQTPASNEVKIKTIL